MTVIKLSPRSALSGLHIGKKKRIYLFGLTGILKLRLAGNFARRLKLNYSVQREGGGNHLFSSINVLLDFDSLFLKNNRPGCLLPVCKRLVN